MYPPGFKIGMALNWTPGSEPTVRPGDLCRPKWPPNSSKGTFKYLGGWRFLNMARRSFWQKLTRQDPEFDDAGFYEDPSHYEVLS